MIPQIPVTVNGVAADLLSQYPQTAARLEKAKVMLAHGKIWFFDHDASGEPIYHCRSTDGSTVYEVGSRVCSCRAHQVKKVCYHRLARGILVILANNKTLVAFQEALPLEEQELPSPSGEVTPTATPSQTTPEPSINHCAEYPVFVPSQSKRVQSAGFMTKGLTIRASMNALGERIKEVFSTRPKGATIH
jgi:hypothetical protein